MTAHVRSDSIATQLLLAAILITIMGRPVSAAPDSGLPALQPCPPHEELFISKSYGPLKRYGYRLIISDVIQEGTDWSTVQPWTIQEFERGTGKVVNELLLKRTFPNGRANWNVSPLHQSRVGAVDEIDMDPKFKPARGPTYALAIPGFADWNPAPLSSLIKSGDLRYPTRSRIVPDLSGQLAWVASCIGHS